MGRIIRAASIITEQSKLAKSKSPAKQVLLEVNSALGRQSIAFDLSKAHEANSKKRLKLFLESNGYASIGIDKFLKLVNSYLKSHVGFSCVRIENLGIKPEVPLNLPRIGQSHELEFARLRAKLRDEKTIDHGEDLFESSNKLNGVASLKIVSETLGKTKPHATTEVVLGPAATKSQYEEVLAAVDNFRKLVSAERQEEAQNIGGLISQISLGSEMIIPKKASDGVVWNLDPNNTHRPCVHTSRGAPIRATSIILQDNESGLFKYPRKILELSGPRTDEFIAVTRLRAPRGAKLWETLNLSIWMAACEGVVQPLMHNDLQKIYAKNRLLTSWTLYAGKNFFGTLPRFSAGDLLRTGGLQARDEKQLLDLFAGENLEDSKKNMKLLVEATLSVVKDFLSYLATTDDDDAKEIVSALYEHWSETESWVSRDLKSDFIPRANKKRYPHDSLVSYGNKVDTHATSPSFASSQYLPRRERLSSDLEGNAPVSGAFEFRASSFAGNTKMGEHFLAPTAKRKQKALDSSWASFERYVGRLAKKQRV